MQQLFDTELNFLFHKYFFDYVIYLLLVTVTSQFVPGGDCHVRNKDPFLAVDRAISHPRCNYSLCLLF